MSPYMRMCRYLAVCPPGTALSFVIGCSRRSHQSDFADFEVCKRQNGEKDSSGCKRRRTNLPILPKFQVQNCRSISSPRHKDWRTGLACRRLKSWRAGWVPPPSRGATVSAGKSKRRKSRLRRPFCPNSGDRWSLGFAGTLARRW